MHDLNYEDSNMQPRKLIFYMQTYSNQTKCNMKKIKILNLWSNYFFQDPNESQQVDQIKFPF